MPRMTFGIINSLLEDITSVKDKDTLKKHSVQRALDLWAQDFNYDYLMEDSFITTVAPYTTGTAAITNGSKTVTGSGTTFTAAMVDRKIRFASDNAYYRIASFTSTTVITLEAAYQGDTTGSTTFSIYKDEYRLPADLARYKMPRQIENGVAIADIDASTFDLLDPSTISEGDPFVWALIGSKKDTYSTGTVAGDVGSATLTGTTTAWDEVEGFGRGSRLTIVSQVYTVKSVDSATQVTLYRPLSTAASGTAYSIDLDNYRILMQSIPNKIENVYFRYQRVPAPLENDTDLPDMPDEYHWFLIDVGKIWLWESKDKAHSRWIESQLDIMLRRLRKQRVSTTKTYKRFPFSRGAGSYQPPHPGEYGRPFSVVRR